MTTATPRAAADRGRTTVTRTLRSILLPGLLGLAAAALPGTAAGQDGSTRAAPGDAQRTLPDTLDLPAVVERVLAVDPALAAARAGRDAAAQGVRAAEADRFPSLSLVGDATRFQEQMVVAPLHGFDPTAPPDFDETLLQGSLRLGWTLYDGGARGARITGAREGREAAGERAAMVRQERTLEVVRRYLAVLTSRDVVVAQARREEALAAERDRVARFLEEGTAPRLELLRAEAELASVRADGDAARARLEVAERGLARLLEVEPDRLAGRPLRDVAPADGGAPAPDAAPRTPSVDTPNDAIADDHPALAAARARLGMAEAGVDEAHSAWIPRLRLTGAFQQLGGGETDFTDEWQAGLRLEYPLFTGGARDAGVDRARAEARAAREEIRAVRRDLRDALDRARGAVTEAAGRVVALEEAVRRFEELVRVEALALAEGAGVQTDYLRAEAGLFDARAGLARARRALVEARAAEALARGRLDLGWIERTLTPLREGTR